MTPAEQIAHHIERLRPDPAAPAPVTTPERARIVAAAERLAALANAIEDRRQTCCETPPARPCAVPGCVATFTPAATGRPRRYCSPACATRARCAAARRSPAA